MIYKLHKDNAMIQENRQKIRIADGDGKEPTFLYPQASERRIERLLLMQLSN